jgi:archaellum biogenesis protein FlaJ (TadC family)
MDSTLRLLRSIQVAMLVSIALYVFIGERVAPGPRPANAAVYYVLSLASITTTGIILVMRRTLVRPSERILRTRSDDLATLNRWRTGHIATLALSESLPIYALVLRFLGFSLSQLAPLYLAGFVLLLFLGSCRPTPEMG